MRAPTLNHDRSAIPRASLGSAYSPVMSIPVSELLGDHAADEVKAWLDRLAYFALVGAYAGDHVSSSEALVLYVSFAGRDDLELVLGQLGILTRGDGSAPSPIATPGEPRNVAAFPDLVEPEDCRIAGVACDVRVLSSTLRIAVAERGGGVTAARVADAQAIEAQLARLGLGARISQPDDDFVIRRDQL